MEAVTCKACGQDSPATMRFCPHCGSALTATSPPEEERRLVTALFCDLVGFTPLCERLDPEAVWEIQGAYFARMRAEILHHGGKIENYVGDAILALFGAPVAHEDDAERAIRCALAMVAALRPLSAEVEANHAVSLSVRIGINSGDAVRGVRSTGDRPEHVVTGDAINTAARFQTAASPGEILVGEETMRLARRAVFFGPRRSLTLKGKSGEVPGYPVVELRLQPLERWEVGPRRTPFVGRQDELRVLLVAWDQSSGGRGQLVSVVAEPGVGKSRLLHELEEGLPNGCVVRARCLSHTQEVSLWLVADLIRALCGIDRDADPAGMQRELNESLARLLDEHITGLPESAADILGEALGLPAATLDVSRAEPQVRRQVLTHSLAVLLAAQSARAATLLILEDLQWIDTASARVLTELLVRVPRLRLLVAVTHRPEWNVPWRDWNWPREIRLGPLDGGDTAVLLRAALGGARTGVDLERYVRDRTEGNPFFVEELARNLRDLGALVGEDDILRLDPTVAERLPSTLVELVLARLDRLSGEIRSLAQTASVIGRSFPVGLLATVTGREAAALAPDLSSLNAVDIAYPRWGVDLEYVFRHATIRDVAYSTLLQRRRQRLHATVAQGLLAMHGDIQAEMIAYHFARSDDAVMAATWLERAGDRAAAVYANETAVAHYEEARQATPQLTESGNEWATIEEKLAAVLTTMGQYDRALALYEAVARFHAGRDDADAEARILAQIGEAHYHRGTAWEGIARLEGMAGRDAVSDTRLAALQSALTILFFAVGDYRRQLDAAVRSAELARRAAGRRPDAAASVARAEVSRGLALLANGRRDEARQALEGAVSLAESCGDLVSLARAHDNLSNVYYFRAQFEQSRVHLEQGLRVAERMGDPALIGHMLFMLGTNAYWVGDWNGSRHYHERSLAALAAMPSARVAGLAMFGLGQVEQALGNWDAAERLLREAEAQTESTGNLPMLKWIHKLLAEQELGRGRPRDARDRLAALRERPGLERSATILSTLALAELEVDEVAGVVRADQAISEALAQATIDDDRIDLADSLRVATLIAVRKDRWPEAASLLEQGLALASSMPYVEARLVVAAAALHTACGDHEEARRRLEEALATFSTLGATKDVERVQALLAR